MTRLDYEPGTGCDRGSFLAIEQSGVVSHMRRGNAMAE